jgi:hypothetical protein
MTAMDWLSAKSPRAMLMALEPRARAGQIDRKLRLFACSCVRHVWPILDDERSRKAVEAAERYADGLADREELEAANHAALDAVRDVHHSGGLGTYLDRFYDDQESGRSTSAEVRGATAQERAWAAAHAAHWLTAGEIDGGAWMAAKTACHNAYKAVADVDELRALDVRCEAGRRYESPWQSDLLRCIFGDPFRLLTLDRSCLSGPVVRLAGEIYDGRGFDRMPMLGEALEGAGCADEVLLAHCRISTVHSRGCWAIDTLLGKT